MTPAVSYQTDQLWSQAQIHLAAKQAREARAALEALLAADPSHILARLALCNVAWRQDRVREAAGHALLAARDSSDYPELICETIGMLLRVGEHVAARDCLRHPALARVTSDVLLQRLADQWDALGQHDAALHCLDRARELGFDGGAIRFRRGRQLVVLGRLREAEPELELAALLGPTNGEIALALGRLRTQTRECNHLNRLATGLKGVTRGSRQHAALEFALYKELEDLGRHDEAWEALARGNAMMRTRLPHDAARQRLFFDHMIARCTPPTLRPIQRAHPGPQPIFILGLPGSGIGVLNRLLGRHSQVGGTWQLDDFTRQLQWCADHRSTQDGVFLERLPKIDFEELAARYLAQTQWRVQDKPFFIDTQPSNWMLVGPIHTALPVARILHLVRDPMDVCFSQYRAYFGDAHAWSYDFAALAAHYHDYRRVMTHWHAIMPGAILDVPFAKLVREPETTLRGVLDFCGLAAEPVPVPVDIPSPALGQWRPYGARIEPLQRDLAGAQPGGL